MKSEVKQRRSYTSICYYLTVLNFKLSSDNKALVNVAPRGHKKELFYEIVWFMSFDRQIILDTLAC